MPPVERCPQCGTPRRGDLQVCVRCETPFPTAEEDVELALPRPAAPSPTQSHGTVMVALMSGFVVLGVLLWLSVRGVGPFTAEVVRTAPRGDGKADVTVSVHNDGSKGGHGKCSIERVDAGGVKEPAFQFLSERVPGGETITQTVVVELRPGGRIGQVAC